VARATNLELRGYGDDVALAAGAGRLWIAASTATRTYEEVHVAELTGDGFTETVAIATPGAPCYRPAICAVEDRALAVACTPEPAMVGALIGPRGEVTRWRLATEGVPVQVAVAAAAGVVWIAVELARGGTRRIMLAELDPARGIATPRGSLGGAATWSRWPALAVNGDDPVLVWCEGPIRAVGRVVIARLGSGLEPSAVSVGAGAAPAIAVADDNTVAVAWHVGGATDATDDRDASVVRSLEVALVSLASGEVIAAPPPLGAGGPDPRGTDQGWELPAIAIDQRGAIWLAGRSTHGHQLARRDPDGAWGAPVSLCGEAWGGRGRRHALVIHAGAPWLGRRSPDGIVISQCDPPPAAASNLAATSLPAAATTRARVARTNRQRVLFGDLHQHTAHSDGCGSPEELWIAARDRRGLDFAAITDHDVFCRRAIGPATWRDLCRIADEFDEPGRFTAISGYEFTGPRHPGPGHKCVYFGDHVPDHVPDRDLAALFAMLRELDGVAVPHHVGWTGGDFAHHDPWVQPVWEICSVHGCYEAEGACGGHPPRADHVIPGQFVRDALDAGLRFGFIGSTDSHGLDWHHGIARWRNPFRAGLACIVGAEPTRGGIIAAIRARRTYATSGARIGLEVHVDGAPMGSELPLDTRGDLVVEVDGTAPVARIVVVRDGADQVLDHGPPAPRASARAALPRLDRPGYIYVRVEQVDGEAAWASPIWLG
jgi:hypothetical protein